MLSVFNVNKRNKTQSKKKFSTIAGLRRVQSPPSPASFVSPEIVEINEQGPFGGSFPEGRAPAPHSERSLAATISPQLQLEFDSDEPLFPPSILPTGNRTPPKRNVSLPNGGKSIADSSSFKSRGVLSEDTIREEPLQPNRLQVDTSTQFSRSSDEIYESSAAHASRKPTPSPIKIPNNSTSAKIRVQSSTEDSAGTNSGLPLPPTRHNGPPSPSSALTDDISSAVSGTSMARALVATSFILSSESRASKYKSGITRQDSATLPRGEHPLNNSPYLRERRASSGDPGSARSSSVPPVPKLPSELSLGADGGSLSKSQRNSVVVVLDSGENSDLVPPPTLRRPKSTGRLGREQTISMPPISPISEASSPAPSVPETPGHPPQGASSAANSSSRSLANSVAQQRGFNLSEGNASSSSLGTDASSHMRAATDPAGSFSSVGERRPSNASKPKGMLPPGFDRGGSAMPGTMRSSGAFSVTNGRLAVTRTISESGGPRVPTPGGTSRPAVLLPIGERPPSVLPPPSPQPSTGANIGVSAPTSSRATMSSGDTPVDSPDLLDNFPLQIARERSAGPPPPLPLGRRSEESAIPTPLQSSSGESMSGASLSRQTFPETPNAFSPLWSGTFASPPSNGPRSSMDQGLGRNGSIIRSQGLIDMTRMAPRGPGGRVSGTIFAKPTTRSSRVPPTPPLTGESTNGSHPDSPIMSEAPLSQAIKRLTAIEEQVASRSVSQYSTLPEPPTSGMQFGIEAFASQQQVNQARQGRDRSESVSAYSRDGSDVRSQAPTQTSSNSSASARAKAAEASAHRRMRSVTNPDEPLTSPPPSYPATFDPAPPPPAVPLPHPRSGTGDSSEQSYPSSLQSSAMHLTAGSSQSSIPQKRSLSPFPSPPPSSVPLPPSPGPSRRLDAHASSISVEQPPPPYMEMARGGTPPVLPQPGSTPPSPPVLTPAPNSRPPQSELPAPPSTPLRAAFTPDTTPSKRLPRTRPNQIPHGPRAPSYGSAAARMRAGSVTSLSSAAAGAGPSRMVSMAAQPAPRFQQARVNYRGLTMEAAQWTLTSQQLQHIVSTAIRQSADASAIRILPHETLEHELPEEIERLELRSAELKTTYKLGVRRRNALLATLARLAEGAEHAELNMAGRIAEELSEIHESLDQTAEELYSVTDQLTQLAHLHDLHQRSALAMALRKLNSSFLKQVGEVQRLREMVQTLEAERDEAWQEAQEVAQEFDDFTDRIMLEPAPNSGKDRTPSRRSSRVMLARKTSQRASKAGLRSSMYRRSQRSSTSSSHRYSGAASPGSWQAPGGSEDIPPVPPIPQRRDLMFFPSGDLPTRSSMDSPSSEIRAMVQAQRELCEMLGISPDELKVHQPSRRQSMSAVPGPKSPASVAPLTRRNSDIVTPNHQRTFKM